MTRFVIGWENNRDGDITMPHIPENNTVVQVIGPNEIRGLEACRSIARLEKI